MLNLGEEFRFHLEQGRLGTVLGVNPPSRFGELRVEESKVQEFSEKPEFSDNWINGGYFFFHRDFLPYLSPEESCVLERDPLIRLARDGQLSMFKHQWFLGLHGYPTRPRISEQTLGVRPGCRGPFSPTSLVPKSQPSQSDAP